MACLYIVQRGKRNIRWHFKYWVYIIINTTEEEKNALEQSVYKKNFINGKRKIDKEKQHFL